MNERWAFFGRQSKDDLPELVGPKGATFTVVQPARLGWAKYVHPNVVLRPRWQYVGRSLGVPAAGHHDKKLVTWKKTSLVDQLVSEQSGGVPGEGEGIFQLEGKVK